MTEINRDLCHFLIYVAPLGEYMPVAGKAALQDHFLYLSKWSIIKARVKTFTGLKD